MTSPRRILLYRLGSLGDTLISLPCLHSLRRWFPEAQLTWLTNLPVHETKARSGSELLEGSGLVDDYIRYPTGTRDPRQLLALRNELRARRFDLVVNLASSRGRIKSLRDFAFLSTIAPGRVIGTPWSAQDLEYQLRPGHTDLYESEAMRLVRRVARLGTVDLEDRSLWSLNLQPAELHAARDLLSRHGLSGPYIVASLGTKSDVCDWTQPHWLELMDRLADVAPGLGLVMLGAPDEKARTQACLDRWRGPTWNAVGALSVRQSASVLAGARVYFGHDSGPMHLAASTGVRCVAIFSSRAVPGHWFPAGPGHVILYNQVSCQGCYLVECPVEKKRCILATKPAHVAEKVRGLLVHPNLN